MYHTLQVPKNTVTHATSISRISFDESRGNLSAQTLYDCEVHPSVSYPRWRYHARRPTNIHMRIFYFGYHGVFWRRPPMRTFSCCGSVSMIMYVCDPGPATYQLATVHSKSLLVPRCLWTCTRALSFPAKGSLGHSGQRHLYARFSPTLQSSKYPSTVT
jgi:hypothetical protein